VRQIDLDGWDPRLRGRVVNEGLATAFERDYGRTSPPWGQVPPDVSSWTKEVLALPDDAPVEDWMRRHPDGRRWIGGRVGTHLADCAKKATGKTSVDLVGAPADAVIAMCPAP
jgi:hypothetical protein